MSTLVEFLHPVRTSANRDRCLAVLLFAKHFEGQDGLTAGEISQRLISARVPKAKATNTADVLSKAAHLVDGAQLEGKRARLWRLTRAGEDYIAPLVGFELSGRTAVSPKVTELSGVLHQIGDDTVRGYVAESITCLSAGALRAAVVFLWTGAVRTLQQAALATYGPQAVTSALQVHDPKARKVTSIDSFGWIKDSTFLLAAQDLGMFDKGERATLEEALNLRNRCGHPTRYKVGQQKAAGFIEDVVGLCFK